MDRTAVIVQLPDGRSIDIRLDRTSPVPLQEQLAEQLKHYIGTRRIEQGHQLPSVRGMASTLGVSPVTVSRAYEALQARGLVESRAGSGVFVVDFASVSHPVAEGVERLREFAGAVVSQALRVGLDPRDVAARITELADLVARRDPAFLLVVDEFDSVDHLVEQLSSALADDGITVQGVHLSDLAANQELVDRAGVIASAPHCYGLVRRTLSDRTDDIVGLTMVLGPEVNDRLRRIDHDSRVVVVGTQPSFLIWMSRLVQLQVPLAMDPVEVAMDGDVADRIRAADVVVYGSGVRHKVPPLLPPDAVGIELSHVPDAESISNLRRQIRTLKARPSPPAEAVHP